MGMQTIQPEIVQKLSDYFSGRGDVVMAFLFGSFAKGNACAESDADVAVYFAPVAGRPDDAESASEDEVWRDVERIVGREADLLVLNRAAPIVAFGAIRGIPLAIKDRDVYMSFLLRTMTDALDFQEFIESWWRLKRGREYGASSGG
ncbi:MAG: nucleotidyltransferase domain-containing protein [Pseudomonadota bacterium]